MFFSVLGPTLETMRVTRRGYLRSIGGGAAVGMAGCLGSDDGGPKTVEAIDNDGVRWRLWVESTTVQASAFAPSQPMWEQLGAADGQFLFAEIGGSLVNAVGGYSIPYDLPGSFSAEVNGTTYTPTDIPYRPDGERGAFTGYVFDVTATQPIETGAIVWRYEGRREEWPLAKSTTKALETRPRAADLRVKAPEDTSTKPTPTATISANNVGDSGTIRVAHCYENRTGATVHTAEVASGERATWEIDLWVREDPMIEQRVLHAFTPGGERVTKSIMLVPPGKTLIGDTLNESSTSAASGT